MQPQHVTIPSLAERKKSGQKIVALTAYDYCFAKILDALPVDLILVGDSAGMVALGYGNTLPVTMDEMIHHTRAVTRGANNALVVGDMPFMSYQVSNEQAISNAGRFIQEGGAAAVKMEGGARSLERAQAVVQAGISVMGHIGLTPQSVHQFGGYRVQGKSFPEARQIKKDALALQKAGVFALVLEGIPAELAGEITAAVDIPTVGIGAGPSCDGQILVLHDMLGLNTGFTPKYVKPFAQLRAHTEAAIKDYAHAVQTGAFPAPENCYHYPVSAAPEKARERKLG